MNKENDRLSLTGSELRPEDVREVAFGRQAVTISPQALAAMEASHQLVASIVSSGKPTYGISTGFGDLSRLTNSEDMNAQ